MVNCFTFPWGTPSTTLRSGAGLYSGPITKLPSTSSGGFSPAFNTLKGGEPGSSNLRTGGCANAVSIDKNVKSRNVAHGLDMRYLVSRVDPKNQSSFSSSPNRLQPRERPRA